MAKRELPEPTERELSILRILWDCGSATVREVNERMAADRPTGYTTTLKLMQIMMEKGLLEREERGRTHLYRAAVSEDITQRRLVGSLLDKAFAGSTARLVMQALASKKVSKDELAQIRELLEKAEGGEK